MVVVPKSGFIIEDAADSPVVVGLSKQFTNDDEGSDGDWVVAPVAAAFPKGEAASGVDCLASPLLPPSPLLVAPTPPN